VPPQTTNRYYIDLRSEDLGSRLATLDRNRESTSEKSYEVAVPAKDPPPNTLIHKALWSTFRRWSLFSVKCTGLDGESRNILRVRMLGRVVRI